MSGKSTRTEIGAQIRRTREYCGYSQQDVATYLSIPRTAVTQIEAGARRVDAIELKRLAALFQCTVAQLVGEEDSSASSQDIEMVARATQGLSDTDREEVMRFAQFLKSRQRGSPDGRKKD